MRNDIIKGYVPELYREVEPLKSIYEALGEACGDLFLDLESLLKNCFVPTSDFSLSLWERLIGLKDGTGFTNAERRSNILAKLNSEQTLTYTAFSEIVNSFEYGNILIIEGYNNYQITLKFIDENGIPSNLDDFKARIREVVPAHIDILYEDTYNTYTFLSGFTYGELESFDYDTLREGVVS